MSEKFINWIDKKGVPIMGFIALSLTMIAATIAIVRLLFPF
jgi:hypothetical protein